MNLQNSGINSGPEHTKTCFLCSHNGNCLNILASAESYERSCSPHGMVIWNCPQKTHIWNSSVPKCKGQEISCKPTTLQSNWKVNNQDSIFLVQNLNTSKILFLLSFSINQYTSINV